MVIRLSSECRELLEHQQGVLARWQADKLGLTRATTDSLIRRERWQTTYRGVYAAYTGKVSRDSVIWAAVLRCGPDAALSHFTAAELDGLSDGRTDAIHVTVPAPAHPRLSGKESNHLPSIMLHRSWRIGAARHPARTPPRTRIEETVLDLTDIATTFDSAFFWLTAACGRRLVTPGQLRMAAAGRARMRWRAEVLEALEEITGGVLSRLERGYVRDVERPHGLPRAKRQVRMKRGSASAYLDGVNADYGVAVELDGRAAHPVEARWQDIHRDNYFARSGIITLRYSWADITERPCQVAMEVALVLRQRGWEGTPRSCGPECPIPNA